MRRLIRSRRGDPRRAHRAEERASVDELFAVIRRARANIDTALPVHLSAVVRQPQPTLYPRQPPAESRLDERARTAAATARRRADSEHKRQRVLTVAGAFIDRGQDFSLEQSGARGAGQPRVRAPRAGLKAEIDALRHNATVELEVGPAHRHRASRCASLKAENAFLKRRLHEREQDVATLKRRLGEALGQAMFDAAPPATPMLSAADRRARAAAIRGAGDAA